MGNIGLGELIVIAVIVLLVFGANRLPSVAKAFGQSVREFRSAAKGDAVEPKASGDDQ